jgi:hypothetical protein
MENLRIYAADIGSIRADNFGWACANSTGSIDNQGTDIFSLVGSLAIDLSESQPVALGFEAPIFLRIREKPDILTCARDVDQGKAWSAPTGVGAFATGTVQVPWLLRRLAVQLTIPVPCFLNWEAFQANNKGLFIWEAFVTGDAKGDSHVDDASIAVGAFQKSLPDPNFDRPAEQGSVMNLAGCALLWSGLSDDLALLKEPCIVIKA